MVRNEEDDTIFVIAGNMTLLTQIWRNKSIQREIRAAHNERRTTIAQFP